MGRPKKMADNSMVEEVIDTPTKEEEKTLYEEYMEEAPVEENVGLSSAIITEDGFVVEDNTPINNENEWTAVLPEDLSSHTIESNIISTLSTSIINSNPKCHNYKCAINCGGVFAKQS